MFRAVQQRVLNWWNHGEQDRPCLLVYARKPAAAVMDASCEPPGEYWLDPKSHERRALAGIEATRCFGEAVPYHYVDFGASALCGMQGCKTNFPDRGTIWAEPLYRAPGEALEAATDPDLPFSRSVRGAFERVAMRLKGKALVGPYCFGSPCDNLAGLIGTENFIYSLYDDPETLKRAVRRQLDLWTEEFAYVRSVLRPSPDRPMTGWHGILAPGGTFPIQEDIGYMLGTEHYARYCMPGIRAMAECMEYPFFHLDGAGALKHLDALLGIGCLKAIQWQPGEGRMDINQWYDVVRKILAGGNSCQLYVRPEEIGPLTEAVGRRGLLLIVNTDEEKALRLAEQYRLEENMPEETMNS